MNGAVASSTAAWRPLKALLGVLAREFADQPGMAVVGIALVFKDPNQVVLDVAGLQVLCALRLRLLAGVVQDVAGRVVLKLLARGALFRGGCFRCGCKRSAA